MTTMVVIATYEVTLKPGESGGYAVWANAVNIKDAIRGWLDT